MWLRRFTDHLLSNNLFAVVVVFAISGLPLIGLLGSLIAIYITLRKGMQDGALVFIASLLPVILLYEYLPQQRAQTSVISLFDVVIMLLLINFVAWLAAAILRRTSSWSVVLDVLGLLGVTSIAVLHLAYPDLATWWQQWLSDYVHNVEQALTSDASGLANLKQMPRLLKDYATGFTAVICSVYALFGLSIARWWQAVMVNPGGLRRELLSIRLSKLTGFVALACILGAGAHISIFQDALLMIAMVFALAGFSVIHDIVGRLHIKWQWLTITYLILSFNAKSIWLIALIGFIDMLIDCRKQLSAKLV